MELIEKYGGVENKSKGAKKDTAGDGEQTPNKGDKKTGPAANVPGRTNLPPPPTANIVRQAPVDAAQRQPHHQQQQQQQQRQDDQAGAEFAPNAFNGPPPPAPRINHQQYMTPETHWYDRIFDVLLGEDETAAKNRFALICEKCRLVNGQAPPGTKSLAEVGMWRCMSCDASNGEVDEGKRIIDEVLSASKGAEAEKEESGEEVHGQAGSEESHDVTATGTEGPASSVKARRRAKN